MRFRKGQIYEIEWLDTFSYQGWWDDEELNKKTQEMTYFQKGVGIFAGEDKNWIILVSHENPNKNFSKWGHPNWIPKGCIRKVKKI